MLDWVLEKLTGKDDLERVAYKEDVAQLNAYLKTRPIWIPRRPRRFLDASSMTQQQFLELMESESGDFAGDSFEPWVLDVSGKRRLPVFSSMRRMEVFSKKISLQMNKVFALGGANCLIADGTKGLELDYVDLNMFSEKSWEIGMK